MLSDKVVAVLRKKEIPETPEMTEAEAWALISQHDRRLRKPKPSVSVCFSGFTDAEASELKEAAKASGFGVNSGIVRSTTHLCCGPLGAGRSKLAKAEEQGVRVVGAEEFRHMLNTGEVL
ncbi:BRCT domain-containing protein [Solirhodobacter olei]|uniref:BRCT domain-containing protein n=1 Tax=Solirhodobacter olei TaxID=2493082 RepID=UPI000FD7594D|nr:BRCT domain-containing protein [Solirhodobacter olei]